jgi:hypothetical protein
MWYMMFQHRTNVKHNEQGNNKRQESK